MLVKGDENLNCISCIFFLNGQIAVEVEDDYPDGIVQAEEEEEERMEPEVFAGGAEAVFRSRERAPRISSFQGSVDGTTRPGKKRKIDGTSLKGKNTRYALDCTQWDTCHLQ